MDEQNIIQDLHVVSGCSGNLQGIAAMANGMKPADVAQRLRGIRCGSKSTSCPDQLAQALESIPQ
ncbi:MAG: TIGR03905 family TSCPD domain-containing protein [Muribaculaceae bacterium]|nr:TIGR03905 family TSCPD domain-containing protein [Muribaculaceae bacterium]